MAYTKIKIESVIELQSGLHIGGDDSFSAIGAIDSPVVRDPITRLPYIPGSSLKGKMRSLLARELDPTPAAGVKDLENDRREIKRLFGSSSTTSNAAENGIQMSRLQFFDCFLEEGERDRLPQVTEVKFENTIDRLTCKANPRQIERVIRGARFRFELVYNVEEAAEAEEDFRNIGKAIRLLENDYLGGGGTRGNGRVRFDPFEARVVTGDAGFEIPELG